MPRMEIALFIIVGFVACVYFSAEKERSPLHGTFSELLAAVLFNLAMDGATVYTVNRLDAVPPLLNSMLHRLFLGSLTTVIYLFYQYIAILVQEETGKPRRLDLPARVFLVLALLGNFLLPITYTVTPQGNYSSGPYMYVPYAAVAFYLLLCAGLLMGGWRAIHGKQRSAIGAALFIEFTVCVLQGLHHTWLISGMGVTLMTLSFYLTLENPEVLRAELVEQKMSMLYLKSQVNPHFLYNTLDTIRIRDTGAGFAPGRKEQIDAMLLHYDKQPPKLTGSSIGVLNVQKRIKLLCGREYGLSYTENEGGGVTAHILLPLKEELA